jgi:superfamily II DNA helicase RecQ
MKIKTFKIRMDVQLEADEKNLNQFMETVSIKKTATEFVTDKINYWSIIVYYEDRISQKPTVTKENTADKLSFPSDAVLNNEEGAVFNALQKWRNDVAIRTSLPGYMICNKSELVTLSKVRPKNLEELGKIRGFSSKKLMKYGDDVLALLNSV